MSSQLNLEEGDERNCRRRGILTSEDPGRRLAHKCLETGGRRSLGAVLMQSDQSGKN
jgi:hypothetical protein